MNANRVIGSFASAVAHSWTRSCRRFTATEGILNENHNMGKTLVDRLGKTLATGLASAFLLTGIGARNAGADTITWGTSTPATDIVFDLTPYGGQTTTIPSESVNISNTAVGQQIPNYVAWGIICTSTLYGGELDTGLINGQNNAATGFFSALNLSDIFNTELSNNRYIGAIDFNGNGLFGSYDTSTGVFTPEVNEMMTGVGITYDTDNNTFSVNGTYYQEQIPEPSLGLARALMERGNGTNVCALPVAAADLVTFRIVYRDSLTAGTWTSLGVFSVTGGVTTVVDTNTIPRRFYRAVSP